MTCDDEELIMTCNHVLEEFKAATSENFPDLLCEPCTDLMVNEEILPEQVHLVCRNCIKSQVAKR